MEDSYYLLCTVTHEKKYMDDLAFKQNLQHSCPTRKQFCLTEKRASVLLAAGWHPSHPLVAPCKHQLVMHWHGISFTTSNYHQCFLPSDLSFFLFSFLNCMVTVLEVKLLRMMFFGLLIYIFWGERGLH